LPAGRSREFSEVGQSSEVVDSELFGTITTLLTWVWVAAFAGMTVVGDPAQRAAS
jgi:hypothetical protein